MGASIDVLSKGVNWNLAPARQGITLNFRCYFATIPLMPNVDREPGGHTFMTPRRGAGPRGCVTAPSTESGCLPRTPETTRALPRAGGLHASVAPFSRRTLRHRHRPVFRGGSRVVEHTHLSARSELQWIEAIGGRLPTHPLHASHRLHEGPAHHNQQPQREHSHQDEGDYQPEDSSACTWSGMS